MRFGVPDMPLAITIVWIWIGFVAVFVACWWLVKWWKKWWKKRHPPPKPEPVLPYAQRLQRRYRDRRLHGRSGADSPVGKPPEKR